MFHESSTLLPANNPTGSYYGMDYVGPVPPGSVRSTAETEWSLTGDRRTGAAVLVGGLTLLGVAYLVWTTGRR